MPQPVLNGLVYWVLGWIYVSASFKRVGLLGIWLDLCLGQFRRRPPTQGLTQALTRLVFSTLSQIGKIFLQGQGCYVHNKGALKNILIQSNVMISLYHL